MTNRMCTVGLDIGTTSLKAVAYNNEGAAFASESRRIEMQYLEDDGAVQDPEAIYQASVEVLLQIATEAQMHGYRLVAVGFSAAMHSLIAISEDNRPLYPAMTWLDGRAANEAISLWEHPRGRDLYQRTGTPVHAMTPLVKLRWMREHRSDIFQEAARFASIKEYVWYRWFGVWEIDVSMASATGLYSLQDKTWDSAALTYAGIQEHQMSTIVPTDTVRRGSTIPEFTGTGFGDDVAFCIGSSDGVLATLAADAMRAEAMVLTIGTSLAVRSGTSTPATDVRTRSFCYELAEGTYVVGAPSNSGGVVLDWLYRNVFKTDSSEDGEPGFADLLESAGPADTNGLYCVPYVAGERAPLWDEHAAMSMVGLRMHHRREHLMRAAVEGVLFNAYWLFSSVSELSGVPRRVVLSGKLFLTPWTRQLCADLLDLPVVIQDDVDGATFGAAMLANEALRFPPLSVARTLSQEILPNSVHHAALVEKYTAWRHLCKTLT